jgi:hypothetical protein
VGWKVRSVPDLGSNANVALEFAVQSGDGNRASLFSYSGPGDRSADVLLIWPSWAGAVPDFDLVISGASEVPVSIVSGPVFDPRSALKPLLKGIGVEVGPGFYSVHAHCYTPLTLRELVRRGLAKWYFRNAFYNTSPNNKDFGFVLWR